MGKSRWLNQGCIHADAKQVRSLFNLLLFCDCEFWFSRKRLSLSLSYCNRISICLSFGWMGRFGPIQPKNLFENNMRTTGGGALAAARTLWGPSGAKVIALAQGLVYCASQKVLKSSAQKKYFEQTHTQKRKKRNFSSSSQKTRLVLFDLKRKKKKERKKRKTPRARFAAGAYNPRRMIIIASSEISATRSVTQLPESRQLLWNRTFFKTKCDNDVHVCSTTGP